MFHLHKAGMLDTQPHKNPLYSEIFQPKPYVVMSEPCAVLSWWWDKWSRQQTTNNEWCIHLLMHSPCAPVRREEVVVACTANTWVYLHLCTSYCFTHSAWCEEHCMSHLHPHCMMFLGVIIIMFDFVACVHSIWPPSQFNQYLYASLKTLIIFVSSPAY